MTGYSSSATVSKLRTTTHWMSHGSQVVAIRGDASSAPSQPVRGWEVAMRVLYPQPRYSRTTLASLAGGMVGLVLAFLFAVLAAANVGSWTIHVSAGLFIAAAFLMVVWIKTAERDQANSRKDH